MLKSITLEVVGDRRLTCEGCEERVEDLLKTVQGVRKVRARSRKQSIEVLFDGAMLDASAIAECLHSAGYETKLT
jgi:copper chaperone